MKTAHTARRVANTVVLLLSTLALPIVTASVASASDINLPNGRADRVSVADLDLSTTDGQIVARERVTKMARTLCDRISTTQDVGHHEHYLACVASSTDAAMQKLLNPAVATATLSAKAKAAAIVQSATDRRAHVSLLDLDLSTPEGVRIAHDRLHRVAASLCDKVADMNDLSQHTNFEKCVDQSMSDADLDIQKLAAQQKSAPSLVGSVR